MARRSTSDSGIELLSILITISGMIIWYLIKGVFKIFEWLFKSFAGAKEKSCIENIKLDTQIGIETANCPYCGVALKKFPGRKTKCKKCNNFMYVRTRPGDGKRILIKEQEIQFLQDEWDKKRGIFEHKKAQMDEFERAKQTLMIKRQANFVPDNDVYWWIYQEKHRNEAYEGRWKDYQHTTEDMGVLLFKERKYGRALEHFLEAAYFEVCGLYYMNGKQLFSARSSLKRRPCKYNTRIQVISSIEALKFSIDDVEKFFKDLSVTNIVQFPLSKNEAWEEIAKGIIQGYNIFPHYESFLEDNENTETLKGGVNKN